MPVSASETTEETEITLPYTLPNGYFFDKLENASYGVPTPEQVREFSGNYKYISYMVVRQSNGSGGIETTVYAICVNELPDDKIVDFRAFSYSDGDKKCEVYCTSSDGSNFYTHRFCANFDNTYLFDYFGSKSSQKEHYISSSFFRELETNIYIYSEMPFSINGNKATTEDKPPVPFTVSYSQELTTDMESNIVYIPSKGGANGDENGNLKEEINGFSVTVTLTDEYKKVMSENNLGTDYSQSSYAVIGCLSTEPITKGTNMQSFFDNKVVLYAYHGDGIYETSYKDNVMPDTILENSNRSNTIASGITPIFNIPRDRPLTMGFSVSAIDFDGLGISRDTPLYVNVIGVHARSYTNQNSNVSYTATSIDDFLELQDPFKIEIIEGKNANNENTDDDSSSSDNVFNPLWNPALSSGRKNNNEKDVKYYYSYCVSSNSFKYSKYPDYQPITLTDKNGNKYNPSTSSLKDLLNIPPNKMTNTTLLNTADKDTSIENNFMDKDAFDDYKHDLTISNNFGSADFTNPVDLFNNSSTYFKFLTAALECLPDWFYSIFTSWFVVFLTLALIKYIFS